MGKIVITLGAITALAAAVTLTGGQAQQPATTPAAAADQQAAVRKATADYVDAFNKGDLQALAASWAPDAEYIDESGNVIQGRENIVALFRKFLADNKGMKMALAVKSVRFVRPDVALGEGTSTLTAADGTVDKGRFTAAWVKADGKWTLTSARDLPADADPNAAPLKGLAWLVGDWQSTDKDAAVTLTCRPALGGSFLQLQFAVKRPDGETQVMQLMGFDPLTGAVKSWTFDSHGGYGEALWGRDGNQWVGEAVGILPDGQEGTTNYVVKFVDDNTFTLQMRDRQVGGQPLADAEVKYVRKAKP